MPTMLDAALAYIAHGFSVFPVGQDKKPITPHGLKDATQTQQGVKEYWQKWPEAGIGVVTDGLIVLDFDVAHNGLDSLQKLQEKYGTLPLTRVHMTGSGGFHYLYRNPNGHNIRNTVELDGLPGVDVRANGGYIVVPPSKHPSGNRYKVTEDKEIVAAPEWLVTLTAKHIPQSVPTDGTPISEGKRNATLTSLAGTMRRKGMPQEAIEAALLIINNKQCNPPLDETAVKAIAKSVSRYEPEEDKRKEAKENGYVTNIITSDEIEEILAQHEREQENNNSKKDTECNVFCNDNVTLNVDASEAKRYKSVTQSVTQLSDQIRDWTTHTNGWFSYEECDKELGINTPAAKNNRRLIFYRLKESGKIEANLRNNKLFRYVNASVRLIDYKSATMRIPLAVRYPFQIEKMFNTYPGNIVVVAGSADAGKTAFLLNFVYLNQFDFPIYYQSSEMGKEELASRLMNFENIDLQDWNFVAEERSRDFADVIRPDSINIIDYMEFSGDFFMIAEYLRQIYEKLSSGIAIVALQKKRGAELGRGGDFGLEKPRLYLSMDKGKLTIQKAKNWVTPTENPNGLSIGFKLVGGCKFIPDNNLGWQHND